MIDTFIDTLQVDYKDFKAVTDAMMESGASKEDMATFVYAKANAKQETDTIENLSKLVAYILTAFDVEKSYE